MLQAYLPVGSECARGLVTGAPELALLLDSFLWRYSRLRAVAELG